MRKLLMGGLDRAFRAGTAASPGARMPLSVYETARLVRLAPWV
ncbi:hypothetical protein [Actinomadura mexicana]|nr:hypothetical protein [Actinomadura mexicana]